MSDASSAVAVAPVVAALTPFVVSIVTAVVGIAATWALTKLAALCHVNVQAAAIDKIAGAASAEAGALVAAAAGNFANESIKISNPSVAAAADRIVAAFPDAVKTSGLTPDHVAKMVVGKIGEWQIAAPSAAPAPSPSPDKMGAPSAAFATPKAK